MTLAVSRQEGQVRNKIRTSASDKRFYFTVNLILGLVTLIVLVPLIFIVMASFSAPEAVNAGKVLLWPVDFTLDGYKAVFKHKLLGVSYLNTFFYTIAGTAINISMTMIAAYPLARKDLPFKSIILFLFTFTMLFSGGTIPTYILMGQLHMINTRWVMIIPGAISVYNMIIARTFLQNIPAELEEAATIDGCSDFQYFFRIAIPLSGTVIAVLTLYYAVAHWNDYFTAFLYLNKREYYPLQIVLREVLIANSVSANDIADMDAETMLARQGMKDLLKYGLIIVSSAPILVLYPFVRKYFLKGVMIGALKG